MLPPSLKDDFHQNTPARVCVIMGSQSDWRVMMHACTLLETLEIPHHSRIVSAHRTPERLYTFAKGAQAEGLEIIIAGAGGAAHLPGMVAALTTLPVLGVPIDSGVLKGQDSLLSIVQMPAGVPVATFAIGKAGAVNAALFAISLLSLSDQNIAQKLLLWRERQSAEVKEVPRDENEL